MGWLACPPPPPAQTGCRLLQPVHSPWDCLSPELTWGSAGSCRRTPVQQRVPPGEHGNREQDNVTEKPE